MIDNDLNNHLYFKTQDYGEDNSIPDLVGLDAEGNSIAPFLPRELTKHSFYSSFYKLNPFIDLT